MSTTSKRKLKAALANAKREKFHRPVTTEALKSEFKYVDKARKLLERAHQHTSTTTPTLACTATLFGVLLLLQARPSPLHSVKSSI